MPNINNFNSLNWSLTCMSQDTNLINISHTSWIPLKNKFTHNYQKINNFNCLNWIWEEIKGRYRQLYLKPLFIVKPYKYSQIINIYRIFHGFYIVILKALAITKCLIMFQFVSWQWSGPTNSSINEVSRQKEVESLIGR